jgi:hypothetical protein
MHAIERKLTELSWVGFRCTPDESEAAIVTDDEIICSGVRRVSGGRRRR